MRLTNFFKIAPNSFTICCFYTGKYFYAVFLSVSRALLSRCLVLTGLQLKLKLVYVCMRVHPWVTPRKNKNSQKKNMLYSCRWNWLHPLPLPPSPSCLLANTRKASTCHPKRGNSKKEDTMVGLKRKCLNYFAKMQILNHFNEISRNIVFHRENRPNIYSFAQNFAKII